MKILIMEDDYTSSAVLQRLMSEYGEVTLAGDGKEAVDLYMSSMNAGIKFDLICLDIMVPEIDGQEVLKIIREYEKKIGKHSLKQRSQIVMITALNDIENLMASFQEQCEGYIIKPFNRDKIQKTLVQLGFIA